MLEYYPQVRLAHLLAVAASGAIFTARGLGRVAGHAWPLAPPARWCAHAVDTVLLTAALMLVAMLPHGTFANGWLAAKLGLLVAYVAAGTMLLRRSRSLRGRLCWFGVAAALFLAIIGVARAHHPLGWAVILPSLYR